MKLFSKTVLENMPGAFRDVRNTVTRRCGGMPVPVASDHKWMAEWLSSHTLSILASIGTATVVGVVQGLDTKPSFASSLWGLGPTIPSSSFYFLTCRMG